MYTLQYPEECICEMCQHSIEEPLCGRCLANETISRLGDVRGQGKTKRRFMRRLRSVNDLPIENMPCVICGKDNVSMCAHCFASGVKSVLGKLRAPEGEKVPLMRAMNHHTFY